MCSISSSELLGLIFKQFVHLTFALRSNLYLVIGANKDLYNKQIPPYSFSTSLLILLTSCEVIFFLQTSRIICFYILLYFSVTSQSTKVPHVIPRQVSNDKVHKVTSRCRFIYFMYI
jgi:hypothetical protein